MEIKNNKLIHYSSIIIILFIIQQTASKIGGLIANLFNYQKIDPQNLFAFVSVHHIVQAIIAILIIITLKKMYDINFGFKFGKVKEGVYYVGIFIMLMLIYILISYAIGYYFGIINPYNYPLNLKNILGTLGFQLLLSGPSEEILFRALPISLLFYLFKKRKIFKWGISLETIVASGLFSIAHIQWSLSPFLINMDFYQLIYAFILGVVYGKVYQKTGSVLYPMIMHSLSNVLSVGIGYLFTAIF